MSDAWAQLSLSDTAEGLARREIDPVALTAACLDRIAARNDALAAFITVCADEAMEAARASAARHAAGQARGPLDGIPIGVKDIIETAGVLTTGNSALFADRVPERSATVWDRLEAAGAILIGKTTTWESAIGGTAWDLPHPPARNPWDPERDTGGSSSGSAAAVAAGLCVAALGTDTGGSIRVPAGWCGCAGFKPTYGLVSRAGVYPLSHTLDHVGPIAWTSEDCALIMDAIAGPDPRDHSTRGAPAIRFGATVRDGVAGLRIGRIRTFERALGTDPVVSANMDRAIAGLQEAGAIVRDVELPALIDFDQTCNLISRVESFVYYRTHLAASADRFGAESRARLLVGASVGAAEYVEAQRTRTVLMRAIEDLMQDTDLLVCELAGSVAPPMGGATTYARLGSRPFNLTGARALSVCTGFDDAPGASGLPIAMQIVGRAFQDDLVLRAGRVVETATRSRGRRPV